LDDRSVAATSLDDLPYIGALLKTQSDREALVARMQSEREMARLPTPDAGTGASDG
jgi:hypothetical protein